MAKVEGIGGIFIKSNDVMALAAWYREKLGVETEAMPDGGSVFTVFFTRDFLTSRVRGNPVFAIEPAKETLPKGLDLFTFNLRVDDLDDFLAEIKTRGVEPEGEMLVWERGKHSWIRDLDGNRIELYEELFVDEE